MTETDHRSTQLDQRRAQSSTAAQLVTRAQAEVTELEQRLQTNTSLSKQHKQSLRDAEAEVTRFKRALKAADRERDRLTQAHKKAAAKAGKARDKAEKAEARYERTVLADLVRREKERDRAGSTRPPATSTVATPPTVATPRATSTKQQEVKATRSRTVKPDPAPEQPDAGTVTATRTAARKTAARV